MQTFVSMVPIGIITISEANGGTKSQILITAFIFATRIGVLLTRARQGMVVFVPPGDRIDATRLPVFYDSTFAYLKDLGISEIR